MGWGQGLGRAQLIGARPKDWAGSSPKKVSLCLPTPSQLPSQDLLKPGTFLLQVPPTLPQAPPPAAAVLPCLAAREQACAHQEMAFS